MALRTDWKAGDILPHTDLNLITATINTNTATIATATTDNATTKAGLTSVQTIATKSQSDVTTLQQTQTTTQNSLNAANAALTVIQNRLTVLETATPPPAVPNAVASFSLGATTNTTQVLSWTAPSGGATPTFYDSRYKVFNSGTWSAGPSVAAGTLTTTITGLTSGENYDYSVVTRNAAGPGAASATLTKRTTTSFTPSPAGTTIPPATQIVMNDGGVVTLAGGIIYLNGSPMGTSGQVILLYVNAAGVVYQENSQLDWWYWDPTQADPWVFTEDPRVAPPVSGTSPGGTKIPPATQIIMNDGGVVTLAGGQVYLNGSLMGFSANVILVYIDAAHVVYQEASDFSWWSWDGSTWQASGDPTGSTGTPGSAPAVARAEGFNTLTFGPNLVLGSNWFHFLWYGGGNSNITQITPTSLRFAGGVNYFNAHGSTTTPGGSSGFIGTAFGGGGYFEYTLKWDNSYFGWGDQGSDGWPSAWYWDLETYLGRDGDHGNYRQTVEVDNMEAWGDNSFTSSMHHWNELSNISSDAPYTGLPGGDHNQLHKFALLWVPATASSRGRAEFYVDDQHMVGSGGSWNLHNDNQSTAPDVGTTAFNIMDLRHLNPLLGSGSGNPMTVTSFKVWQRDASQNMVGT